MSLFNLSNMRFFTVGVGVGDQKDKKTNECCCCWGSRLCLKTVNQKKKMPTEKNVFSKTKAYC